MNATQLLEHFDRLAEAPNAVPRLRRFILDLAVRGKLVAQDAGDELAGELLKRIQAERFRALNMPVKRDTLLGAEPESTDIQLPVGWVWSKLGNLCTKTGSGSTPAGGKDAYVSSGVPFLRSQNVYDDGLRLEGVAFISDATQKRMSSTTVKAGDLLLNITGGSIGRCAIVPDSFVIGNINQHVAIIRLALLESGRFLHSVICSDYFQKHIFGNQTGAGREGLPKNRMDEIPIPVAPLAEQHRIVAKVDELMALCDQLEAAQQERERRRDRLAAASLQRLNQPALDATPEAQREHARFHLQHLPRLSTRPEHIKAMRQTILNLAVRGLLIVRDGTDEPAKVLLKEIQTGKSQLLRLGAIPKEKTAAGRPSLTFPLPELWQVVRLGDVCNLVTSGSRGWAEFYAESGPKFLRAQNIRFGRLRLDEIACVNPPAKSEGARTQVQQGDLLIVITGAGVTNPALLDQDLGEAYVSQHVALVRPSNVALSRWLLLCLMAGPSGRDELVERAYGAGKPGLNLDNIRSLNTPIPPLAEQHRIVAKVDELMALCDQLETQLTTTQTDNRRLLEAVLEAALLPA